MTIQEQRREARPMETRMIPIGSVDAERRTARLLWTSGATGRRYDWSNDRFYSEELSMDPGHVRMERFQSGKAPLLNSHSSRDLSDVIGVIESASGAEAVVRFSSRPDVEPIFMDVKDRILRNVSVGYAVYKREMIAPTQPGEDWVYRVIDWEPMELSIVAIPFDAGAEVRGAGNVHQKAIETIDPRSTNSHPPVKENDMTTEQTAPTNNDMTARNMERDRIQTIHRLVRNTGLNDQDVLIDGYVERGLDLSVVRQDLQRRLADLDESYGIGVNVRATHGNGSAGETRVIEPMTEALVARLAGRPVPANARQYMGYRMVDFARDILQEHGVRTNGLSPNELITRSLGGLHTTSDFPHLLQNTGERLLRDAYASYQGGLRRLAKQTTSRDFRAKSSLMLSEAPGLLKVSEHGEFTRGTMSEASESYRLQTFGRIFGISRQALVNDDLDAFGTLTRRLGIAASEFVADQLVSLLTSNPVMSDGVALFHADHKNMAASGGAISDATLAAARLAMRTQKGLNGISVIDVTPKYLIVPAALENTALKYLASLQPISVDGVNPHSGSLELVVDPRLDAISATAWYLAADPALIDTIEYAYLEEQPGPVIEMRSGFEVDGMEMKVRLDFGAGILDHRGLYRNAGA